MIQTNRTKGIRINRLGHCKCFDNAPTTLFVYVLFHEVKLSGEGGSQTERVFR